MGKSESFTGRERELRNRRTVKIMDVVAKRTLTFVGVGTILTVMLVCVFLVYVALPLFEYPETTGPLTYPAEHLEALETAAFRVDEYGVLGWTFHPNGSLQLFRLDTGEIIDTRDLSRDGMLTAYSFPQTSEQFLLGYSDGTVQFGGIVFKAINVPEDAVPQSARGLEEGKCTMVEGELYSLSETGFKKHTFELSTDDPVSLGEDSPIRHIDAKSSSASTVLAAVTEDNKLYVQSVREQENLLTGEITRKLSGGSLELQARETGKFPHKLLLMGGGTTLYLAWPGGEIERYDTRNVQEPALAEQFDMLEDPEQRLSVLSFLLGDNTLLAGDSTGNISAWFRVRQDGETETPDGWVTVNAHHFAGPEAAVTYIAPSQRTRIVLAGYANGDIRMFHVTTGQTMAQLHGGAPVDAVVLSPKEDGIFALSDGKLWEWGLDKKYPEGSMAALFLPVWYEGMPKPMHIWQSSSGSDSFEPKLGLMPLVFGTLKATLYSMLFGVPIALLAALYTSEFLTPRFKSIIKPTIELMASLPSVVLGFLGALVLAPMVEDFVTALLLSLFLIPFFLLSGAQCWQLFPQRLAMKVLPLRLVFVAVALALGCYAAYLGGPLVDRLFFGGDLHAWLASQAGSGVGGWLLLFFPLSIFAVAAVNSFWVGPLVRARTYHATRAAVVLLDLTQFLLSALAAFLLSYGISAFVDSMGFDPRGGASYLGTYVQRNALVVGFVMGFAVIPIVYTIAEDALSTVPEHLRAASLGAGATPWQTAIRIVLPAAMSGLFSAVMIGLGRAVGETMIVLMAAGNTPIMEWNIFNGLRTLSANIAVEMPEAPKDSTHYRTLFMAALVLFAMTFVVNTAAEFVRLRFRKKASSL